MSDGAPSTTGNLTPSAAVANTTAWLSPAGLELHDDSRHAGRRRQRRTERPSIEAVRGCDVPNPHGPAEGAVGTLGCAHRGAGSSRHNRGRGADVQLFPSSTLKTWVDYVARAGRTFLSTAARPEVLLKGKPAKRWALRRLNGITVCALNSAHTRDDNGLRRHTLRPRDRSRTAPKAAITDDASLFAARAEPQCRPPIFELRYRPQIGEVYSRAK
jgi:Flavodoxin-like fold